MKIDETPEEFAVRVDQMIANAVPLGPSKVIDMRFVDENEDEAAEAGGDSLRPLKSVELGKRFLDVGVSDEEV